MGLWGFWRRGEGTEDAGESAEYYKEGLKLVGKERYHEALTSFRLALRRAPDDPEILQQMAMVYTRIGMPEESVKLYRKAIDADSGAAAAHYGLAFLLLRSGDLSEARRHLEAFLSDPPQEGDAEAHIAHARRTLDEIRSPPGPTAGDEQDRDPQHGDDEG